MMNSLFYRHGFWRKVSSPSSGCQNPVWATRERRYRCPGWHHQESAPTGSLPLVMVSLKQRFNSKSAFHRKINVCWSCQRSLVPAPNRNSGSPTGNYLYFTHRKLQEILHMLLGYLLHRPRANFINSCHLTNYHEIWNP